jgi:hypothetical protein
MNYDDQGGRFGETSIHAISNSPDQVSAYAGLNSSRDRLSVMLVNKDPRNDVTTTLDLHNIALAGQAKLYRYSAATPNAITSAPFTLGANRSLTLPAYSISLLVLEAQQP